MKKKYYLTTSIFLLFFLILLTISILLMYHAKYISTIFSNHFEKQCLWILLGITLSFICYLIPFKTWTKFSLALYLINIILLLLVLIIGTSANGARAWIKIGSFNFQPSEFMKFSYALFLSSFCSNRIFYSLKDEFKFLLKVFIIFLIPSILVFLEPDTGAIIFYLLMTLIVLWNTKISKKWFFVFFLLLATFIATFFYFFFYQRELLINTIGTGFFYRVERLFSFGSGMQIENALIALGSSPLYQWNLTTPGIYIPEAPTDFAFALSSNVFGLSGPILLLICYLILDWSLLTLLKIEKDEKRYLFFLSFLIIFFFSQIENIGMNLGLLPIIGIPLPFLSYGGSCMIVLFAFLGILLQQRKSFTKSKTLKLNYL